MDAFSGETPEVIFEDWLPALQRAAVWNGWSNEEKMMQLAGHLRGRALQEWNLLQDSDKGTFDMAIDAMRTRLDHGSRNVAAQDFRHTVQREQEPVSDFIRRLERTFRLAYGREGMCGETREMLLHGQLQEGLRFNIMKAPAVSGSHGYRQLCLSARNEEKRLAELGKRRQYLRPTGLLARPGGDKGTHSSPVSQDTKQPRSSQPEEGVRRCFKCNQVGHLAWNCRTHRSESTGGGLNDNRGSRDDKMQKRGATKQVHTTSNEVTVTAWNTDLLTCLYSSDTEDDARGVRQVRINDKGSQQQYATVQLQGVPARGIVDSGADITIVGGELFRRVAAAAKLRKSQLKRVDKVPKTYDRKTFTLDGRIDLDLTFDDVTMNTPVYIKMDSPEPLLLAEGVCRQLKIITYHPDVLAEQRQLKLRIRREVESGGTKREGSDSAANTDREGERSKTTRMMASKSTQVIHTESQVGKAIGETDAALGVTDIGDGASMGASSRIEIEERELEEAAVVPTSKKFSTDTKDVLAHSEDLTVIHTRDTEETEEAVVPMVRVRSLQSVRLLPGQSAIVPVRVESSKLQVSAVLLESRQAATGLRVADALLQATEDGAAQLIVSNPSGFTQTVEENAVLGEATEVNVVKPEEQTTPNQTESVNFSGDRVFRITRELRDNCRRKKILELLDEPDLPPDEKQRLLEFLASSHEAFSLEEGERGETDLIEMDIDTGNAVPQRQPPRRIPFSVRQEVARQLRDMQRSGVIEPSKSPWASPVVLVRKRDGLHRFCVDYRGLNAVTKADTFPLPRIDELLDQLGKSRYFSTIDLASGFWQVRMHPDSQKTAFVTYQGLFEFKVMPFGLTNAPAVFQRLMQ